MEGMEFCEVKEEFPHGDGIIRMKKSKRKKNSNTTSHEI
jgi:hypothetical protein